MSFFLRNFVDTLQNRSEVMTAPILSLENITLCRDENVILSGASLDVYPGEFVYLIGKVGSGKSTLIKSIYMDVPIKDGDARFMDFDLRKTKRKKVPYLRRNLGIVFQDFQLLSDRSVYKNLEFVLKATGWSDSKEIALRINQVLDQVGMASKGYKMPHELSGGEQQRVAISRALLNNPSLIMADEPTGHLDPETGEQIIRLLRKIAENGTAVILITHNYALVKKYPARIVKIDNEKLIEMQIQAD